MNLKELEIGMLYKVGITQALCKWFAGSLKTYFGV
jgi:hypothetical protein